MTRGKASKNEASRLVNETLQTRNLNGQSGNGSRFQGQGGQRKSPSAKPGQQVSSLAQIHKRGVGDKPKFENSSLPDAVVNDFVLWEGENWEVKSISGGTYTLSKVFSPPKTLIVHV